MLCVNFFLHHEHSTMDEYYAGLRSGLRSRIDRGSAIYAYPILNGLFFWENDTLFELSKHKKHPRAFLRDDGSVLPLTESISRCSLFTMPRKCDIDLIMSILKKMEHVNGVMLVRLNDELRFLHSFTSYLATSQVVSWIVSAYEASSGWNEFLDNTLIETGDGEADFFVFKHVYYFVSCSRAFDSRAFDSRAFDSRAFESSEENASTLNMA